MNNETLSRIAEALERIAPPPAISADLTAASAYVWDGHAIQAVDAFDPVNYDLLTGIDAQKATLLENTRRHAAGHAAHDALLWGARGTGKSAVVAAVIDRLQREGADIALLQCAIDELNSLPRLFSLLRTMQRHLVIHHVARIDGVVLLGQVARDDVTAVRGDIETDVGGPSGRAAL